MTASLQSLMTENTSATSLVAYVSDPWEFTRGPSCRWTGRE